MLWNNPVEEDAKECIDFVALRHTDSRREDKERGTKDFSKRAYIRVEVKKPFLY